MQQQGQSASDDSGDDSDEDREPPEWLQHSDGRFSPPPLSSELVTGQAVMHEDEDREQLQLLRRLVQEQQRKERRGALGPPAASAAAGLHPDLARLTDRGPEDAESLAARRLALSVMGDSADGEVPFGGEVPLESQVQCFIQHSAMNIAFVGILLHEKIF